MIKSGRNEPPALPEIRGTTNGKTGEEYDYDFYLVSNQHFEPGSEPFEDYVYCHVEWGDGTDEWIGPFNSGTIATLSHSWSADDTYTIRAKSFDSYGEESDWATLDVTMPRNRAINTPFLNFLQDHPNLFLILRYILGLQ
jgi:hypothetical protein